MAAQRRQQASAALKIDGALVEAVLLVDGGSRVVVGNSWSRVGSRQAAATITSIGHGRRHHQY